MTQLYCTLVHCYRYRRKRRFTREHKIVQLRNSKSHLKHFALHLSQHTPDAASEKPPCSHWPVHHTHSLFTKFIIISCIFKFFPLLTSTLITLCDHHRMNRASDRPFTYYYVYDTSSTGMNNYHNQQPSTFSSLLWVYLRQRVGRSFGWWLKT